MIYSRFSHLKKSKVSRSIDWFLGLPRGTDRLFKLSGLGILAALFLATILIRFAILGQLGEPIAALTGFLSCIFFLSSVMIYLAATKITAYRSLHFSSPTAN